MKVQSAGSSSARFQTLVRTAARSLPCGSFSKSTRTRSQARSSISAPKPGFGLTAESDSAVPLQLTVIVPPADEREKDEQKKKLGELEKNKVRLVSLVEDVARQIEATRDYIEPRLAEARAAGDSTFILPLAIGSSQYVQFAPLNVILLIGIIAYGIATRRIMEVGYILRAITSYTLVAAYLVILVWAPLPFASNRTWGGALLVLLVSLVLCGWLLLYLLSLSF